MGVLPASAHPDAGHLLAAKALRGFADGYVSLLLPAYLLSLGIDVVRVGLLTGVTLGGAAAATMLAGWLARRFGVRPLLLTGAGLMVVTGLTLSAADSYWPVLLIALTGVLNPSSGDVSMFLPLEQASLAGAVAERERTTLFSRYHLFGALAAAAGAQTAAVPTLLASQFDPGTTMRAMFAFYAVIGVASAFLYARTRNLPARVTAGSALGPSRCTVLRLAALFSVDAFAGGFVVQAILALWFLNGVGLSLAEIATQFLCVNVLNAISFALAPAVARRFGLINTMVFTHLPANLCLIAAALAPTPALSIAFLLLRALLSQMDAPARGSYVMAIVTPPERSAAASATSVPRSLAAALGPVAAGYMLAASPFGWPLILGGVLKISYDLTLFALFRKVQPPEERTQA